MQRTGHEPGSEGEMACPRCGEPGEGFAGCPACRRDGVAVNLELPSTPFTAEMRGRQGPGPWAWPETLPLDLAADRVSLGEGGTTCVRDRLPEGNPIWVKLEAANPTGSHKDRGAAVAVTRAREAGAEVIAAASSGNAGAATAAYAARAGLDCVVFTGTGIPTVPHAQILSFGATVAAYTDTVPRNEAMRQAVEELGWFPTTNYSEPGAGSNPYAIEGYKSIAYELVRDFGEELGVVVVPTSRADLLAGVAKGLDDARVGGALRRDVPVIAAEPETAAPFTAALRHDDPAERAMTRVTRGPSPAFSVGGDVANWQGLRALERTGGWAEAVAEDEYVEACRGLAARVGVLLEVSSAVAVAAAHRVAPRIDGEVVALGTATGLKDLNPLHAELPTPTPLEPTLDALLSHLRQGGQSAS